MEALNLPAHAILAIPPSRPDKLFGSADHEPVYKALVRKWHPAANKSPEAEKVLSHINQLVAAAKKARITGNLPGHIVIRTPKQTLQYPILFQAVTDSGETIISDKHVVQLFPKENGDLARAARRTISGFDYPSEDRLKSGLLKATPQNVHMFQSPDLSYLVMDRPGNLIRLSDIRDKLDPKHVAWIGTRMFNVAAWLRYSGIRHYGITMDSFYIEPESHIGALLGGWEFSGKEPIAADKRVLNMIPGIRTQKADVVHSLQIRAILRKLLGAETMFQLRVAKEVPAPMRDWLLNPAQTNAINEYRSWFECLEKSFGPRKFTVLNMESPYK